MKKARFILLSAMMIVALLSVGVVSSALKERTEFKPPVSTLTATPAPEVFGRDGIPISRYLQINPISITPEYVIFSDRVAEIFTYDHEDIESGISQIVEAMQYVPTGISKYLLVAPTRIVFENESCQEYSDIVLSAINEVYTAMPSDIQTIYVTDTLAAHQNEYIYFRTEPLWTSLGAYYAAGAYCNVSRAMLPDISQYIENRFTGYVGVLKNETGTETLTEVPDYVAFYLANGMKNEQTITVRLNEDEYVTYDSPVISQARMGADIYVGGYFSHSIIEGSGTNGKSLMIVGDKYAKTFAGWMIPCYEQIILVDPSYFAGTDAEFMQMFADYGITDFLILENVQNLGDSIVNSRINHLLTGTTPE